MIPLWLALKNFLSYQEATLDFRGLHVACISGANGSGKSSLLEAISWAIWGYSRATTEDDVLHYGSLEVRVDFIFQLKDQIYRIIRSRQRGQPTSLEFQVAQQAIEVANPISLAELTFRPLTERGLRATQQVVQTYLKLDYDTFVNSAYLRQGRADEFMLKRPGERKQILADLLKLDQYEQLAEQAREAARQYKAALDVLEQNVQGVQQQLQQQEVFQREKLSLEAGLAELQRQQAEEQLQWHQLQQQQQQQREWEQQWQWQGQRLQAMQAAGARLRQEQQAAQEQQRQLEEWLHRQGAIVAAYGELQALQAEEERLSALFQVYQTARERQQQLVQQQQEALGALREQGRTIELQRQYLQQQQQEIEAILQQAPELEMALAQLQQARQRLGQLEQLHLQAAPLLHRRRELEAEIERSHARLMARLEELQKSSQRYRQQEASQSEVQQRMAEVAQQIQYLEERRLYQQRVRERGQERRSFMERLQENQRQYETQLAALEHKLEMLKQPDASCPLCDRPLDTHHWQLVQQKHHHEHQEILNLLWVVREQLAAADREIQVMRQEYRDLDRELAQYSVALERRGQLQAQLQAVAATQQQLQQLQTEQNQLQSLLQQGHYAVDLQRELQELERQLTELWGDRPYDERDYALARSDVERWRWAEIRHQEIKQARLRQKQLAERWPVVEQQWAEIRQAIADVQQSPLQQQIDQIEQQISALGYDLEHHQAIRSALRRAQTAQLHYQELQRAQQQYPQVVQRVVELTEELHRCEEELQDVTTKMAELVEKQRSLPDLATAMSLLEAGLQNRRKQLDETLAALGRMQQQEKHLQMLADQQMQMLEQIQMTRRQGRIYQELALAFGKNGIQALMIENLLPQLEAEANHLLTRLSNNQLHVQFITQKAGKRSAQQQAPIKMIDTLEILIADAYGTRPYETYSGGEAFRINFAIRLALSRLLAQRSGMALKMLIVDEGFGSLDAEGCDRLIAALQGIAPEFACILMVTHIPHFREAFQTRLEIHKTAAGSQISVLS